MSFVAAGQLWLDQIDRPDSGMSRRTIIDYAGLWKSYVGGSDSALRQLTMAQANDPQRLRLFLQGIADNRGTVSAQKTKALLSNVLEYAVTNDVLTDNAVRRVRAVKAKAPGVRIDEARRLRWSDVHLGQARVYIRGTTPRGVSVGARGRYGRWGRPGVEDRLRSGYRVPIWKACCSEVRKS